MLCPCVRASSALAAQICAEGENKLDSDGDGVCDATEKRVGTDPQKADSDGDGISYAHLPLAGPEPPACRNESFMPCPVEIP